MRLDERGDVREDLGCGAGEALLGGFLDGAAPAALVEGVDLDGAGGELAEEGPVGGVAVVAEAVDED